MREDFLYYYNKELDAIRHLAQDFAQLHPKVAGSLLIGSSGIEDPNVERLVEALAFLTAQIQYKLDDDQLQLAETLLQILYPHLQSPIPSVSIIELFCQPEITGGHFLDKNTLLETRPSYGQKCRFKTVYPCTVWPITTRTVETGGLPLNAPPLVGPEKPLGSIHITLETYNPKLTFATLKPSSLRFYINIAAPYNYILHELILHNSVKLSIANGITDTNPIFLDKKHIRPVGFENDESLLPYSIHSSLGYRLLSEYFLFPEKFLFVEIDQLPDEVFEGKKNQLNLYIYLNKDAGFLQKNIGAQNLKLGCTPIINLYEHTAEPITLDHTAPEYKVIPDANRDHNMEVYSVEKVSGLTVSGDTVFYSPFYSILPKALSNAENCFWHASRKMKHIAAKGKKNISDLYLSFSEPRFKSAEKTVLKIETLCTDADLPTALPYGDEESIFQIDVAAPITKIICLLPFSKPRLPALKNEAKWKLISSLSLNYLSLANDDTNINSFKEILSLYDYTQSAETAKLVNGIVKLNTRHITGRSSNDFKGVLCRGIEVNLTIDEESFQSSGLYLFSSVLEAFFAEYASINSFTKLLVSSKQTDRILFQWKPRSGNKFLL